MSVDKRMTVFEILKSSKSEIKFYRSKSLADFQRFNFQKTSVNLSNKVRKSYNPLLHIEMNVVKLSNILHFCTPCYE